MGLQQYSLQSWLPKRMRGSEWWPGGLHLWSGVNGGKEEGTYTLRSRYVHLCVDICMYVCTNIQYLCMHLHNKWCTCVCCVRECECMCAHARVYMCVCVDPYLKLTAQTEEKIGLSVSTDPT